jgi:hypothetical protein
MKEIQKTELENLMKIKGEVRGAVFQTDAKNVLEKEGEAGLQKLEKRVKELGYDIDYRLGKATEWHPVGLRIISLLLIKDTFGWSDAEIREMGKRAPKFSFIVKFIFKLFAPLGKLIKEIPSDWKEHYTVGEMEVPKFDEEHKELIIRLKDFKPHPLFCLYLEGYIERVLLFVEQGVKTRETKCMLKGDPYHEYTSQWK